MKKSKTGERMFESVTEAGNYHRAEGEKEFKSNLSEMMKPENQPITNLDPFSMHILIVKALNRTPDTPDVNKLYKFVVYTISSIITKGESLDFAYLQLSYLLKKPIETIKAIEKEAVKVIQAANTGDNFKGTLVI
jgi:proline dehydrogenase